MTAFIHLPQASCSNAEKPHQGSHQYNLSGKWSPESQRLLLNQQSVTKCIHASVKSLHSSFGEDYVEGTPTLIS